MKITFIKTAILVFGITLLTACGGGGGGGSSTNNQPAIPINVKTVSGTTLTLEGNWQSPCITSGSDSVMLTIKILGETVTETDLSWIGNTSCAGAPTNSEFNTGTATVATDIYALSAWVNYSLTTGVTPTTSPDAADGSGPLADNEPFSDIDWKVTASNTGSVGLSYPLRFVVDDTTSTPVLYPVSYDTMLGNIAQANLPYVVPTSTASTINIATTSGGSLGLEGPWSTGCVISGSTSTSTNMSVIINVWTLNQATWDGNTTCTGMPTNVTYQTGNISTNTTQQLTGWVNQSGSPASGPEAVDGTGPLVNNASYTTLYATITDATDTNFIGNTVTFFYVADESVAGIPLLYRGNPMNSTANNFAPFSKVKL